jgi:hypothetical protein
MSLGIVFVGADLNVILLPAGPANSLGANGMPGHTIDAAFTAHGQVGVKF